jgi:tetratricopeptide (TPR) repeat protein
MKALSATGLAAALLLNAPAIGSVMTLGNGLARSCYLATEARQASFSSINICDQALEDATLVRHDIAATYVNRGIMYLLRTDYAAADRDFDQALAVDPGQPDAWLNKAVLRMRQGRTAEALPLASRAVELKTSRPALAYYIRGMAYEDAGNLKAAYADLLRAQQLEPEWNYPTEELKRYRVGNR